MVQQPYEVTETRHLHSSLLVAAHAAVELAVEHVSRATHPSLESRYAATIGQVASLYMHNALATQLGDSVGWLNDRGFIAMVLREPGIAMRIGRCNSQGRPHNAEDRDEATPFERFTKGQSFLFEGVRLRPIFAGYSVSRVSRGRETVLEVDRVVLAKFKKNEHDWSWGLDPADPGRVRSVLDGKAEDLEVVPRFIAIQHQQKFG